MLGLRYAGFGGDVKNAAKAQCAVEHEAPKVVGCFFAFALECAVYGRPCVAQIAKEVAHAFLQQIGGNGGVGGSYGLEHGFIDGFVELVSATVPRLQGVVGVSLGARGTARK